MVDTEEGISGGTRGGTSEAAIFAEATLAEGLLAAMTAGTEESSAGTPAESVDTVVELVAIVEASAISAGTPARRPSAAITERGTAGGGGITEPSGITAAIITKATTE